VLRIREQGNRDLPTKPLGAQAGPGSTLKRRGGVRPDAEARRDLGPVDALDLGHPQHPPPPLGKRVE